MTTLKFFIKAKKNHLCDTCGKNFSPDTDVRNHIRAIHMGINIKKCDICTTVFSEEIKLLSHICKFRYLQKKSMDCGK